MRFADRVITFNGAGEVEMRSSWLFTHHSVQSSPDEPGNRDAVNKPISTVNIAEKESQMSQDLPTTVTKPGSDLSIYKYYIGVAGLLKFLVFIGLCTVFAFGVLYSRWSPKSLFVLLRTITDYDEQSSG